MSKLFYTLVLLFAVGLATAQDSKNYEATLPDYSNTPAVPNPDPSIPPPPPNPIPIDGGVGFLIAAGVGYGLKKSRDSKKKQ